MSAEQPATPRRAPSRAQGRRHATPSGGLPSRIGRIVVSIFSVLCLVLTGIAWSLFNGLNSGLSSADGLDVGDGGLDGAVDILLVGTDNRTDAQGNPLSEEELATIRTGEDDGENTDTILLIRIPEDGSSATAISVPRDVYVESSTIGGSKINGVYAAHKDASLAESAEASPDWSLSEEDHQRAVKAGRNGLIDAMEDLTGVRADHYAEIGLLRRGGAGAGGAPPRARPAGVKVKGRSLGWETSRRPPGAAADLRASRRAPRPPTAPPAPPSGPPGPDRGTAGAGRDSGSPAPRPRARATGGR